MGIKDYLRIFKRHTWWIVGWFCLITIGYWFYEHNLKHVRYVSQASFRVKDVVKKKEVKKGEPAVAVVIGEDLVPYTSPDLNARRNIMEGDEVMRRAFNLYCAKAQANPDKNKPGKTPITQSPYPVFLTENPTPENLKLFRSCVRIDIDANSGMFNLSASATNKHKPQWILESLVSAYEEKVRESNEQGVKNVLEQNQQRLQKNQDLRKDLMENKRMDQDKLSKKYGEQLLWDEGTDRKTAERDGIRAEIDKVGKDVVRLQAQVKELEGFKPDQYLMEGATGEATSDLHGELYKEREKLQQELASLRVDFTDKHPKVIHALAKLNSLNAAFPRLAEEMVQKKLREVRRDLSNKTAELQKMESDLERTNKEIQVVQDNKRRFQEYDEELKKVAARIDRADQWIETLQSQLAGLGDPLEWSNKPGEGEMDSRGGNTIFYVMIFGVLIGFVFAYVLEYLDDTIRTAHDVEKFVGLRVIGTVPLLAKGEEKLLHRIALKSPISEMMNTLSMILQSWMLRMKGNTMLIVSSKPGEGKSTFATNLAVALCRGGEKVILIDADLRKPSLHRFFGVDNSVGLSNYLEDSFGEDVEDTDEAKIAKIVHHTDIEGLFIIPSGPIPSNPVGLLKGENVDRLLNHLKTYIGLTLVDTPPLAMIDAGVMATKVDAVVTVMDAGKVTKREALAGKHLIENVGGNNIGVILNKVTLEGEEYYYYFEGYSYYYGSSRARKKKPV